MSTAAVRPGDNEVTILARVFDDERGLLPRDLAPRLSTWSSVSGTSRGCTIWPCATRRMSSPLPRRKNSMRLPRPVRFLASSNQKPAAP